jgi:hypothetical protein
MENELRKIDELVANILIGGNILIPVSSHYYKA